MYIVKHRTFGWILSAKSPISMIADKDVILRCDCKSQNMMNCDLLDCSNDRWFYGSLLMDSFKLDQVLIQNRSCRICSNDADCMPYFAEKCCTDNTQCESNLIDTCVHVGWLRFNDHKIYVLETVGELQIPIERWGYSSQIQLTVCCTYCVLI